MFDDLVLLFALLKNESMVKAERRGPMKLYTDHD
jgi:hypothetical protein